MPEWLASGIFWITLVLMLVGLFGLVVPIFPGLAVIWLAALGYGIVHQFGTLGIWMFILITLLAVGGGLVDNLLMGAQAHQRGAAWTSLALALLAGILGTFFFPPVGGLVAAPLTLLLLEYLRVRDWQKALDTLRGLAVGWGKAFVVRLFAGILMVGLWLVWALA